MVDGMNFGGSWDPADPEGEVTITATMTQRQAMALAQLAKRAHSGSFQSLAANADEALVMAEAVYGPLRDGLADAGFDPR
jgi:hypothetical protein